MMSYLPSIIAALAAVASVFGGPVQAFIAAHPAVAAIIAGAYAILAHFLPSPSAK